MALPRRDAEFETQNVEPRVTTGAGGPSIAELLRNLASDGADLFRQEMSLAKLEAKEAARALASDMVQIGIAVGIAAAGGLALTAFLILVIGNLLDGAFWAGALIVGSIYLLIGGLVARRAIKDLKNRDFTPDETVRTLREDKRWAQREAQDFKDEIAA